MEGKESVCEREREREREGEGRKARERVRVFLIWLCCVVESVCLLLTPALWGDGERGKEVRKRSGEEEEEEEEERDGNRDQLNSAQICSSSWGRWPGCEEGKRSSAGEVERRDGETE